MPGQDASPDGAVKPDDDGQDDEGAGRPPDGTPPGGDQQAPSEETVSDFFDPIREPSAGDGNFVDSADSGHRRDAVGPTAGSTQQGGKSAPP